MNNQLFKLLESIEKNTKISKESFLEILNQYNTTEMDYNQKREQIKVSDTDCTNENWLELRKEIFAKKNRNYFTIASKEDFNNLLSLQNEGEWRHTLIYNPLNDHSRKYLKRGDILFCYRQGQFESLAVALETRGIYGIGVAVSDPLELFPEETGHNRYGIVVAFPILLNSHLKLKNIQMHPKTIDLTPYNGNRNDALQHIAEEDHYSTLLGLILKANSKLKKEFEYIFDINIQNEVLPEEKWKNTNNVSKNHLPISDFAVDLFLKSLEDAGLIYNKQIVVRFISSLCSKPFVILTGLSGSGKTQLALSFAKWISNNNVSYFKILKQALYTDKDFTNYEIVSISEKMVEVINLSGSAGKIIPLPTKAIYEWYDALTAGVINRESDPKETRHVIGENSIYQKHIHGFYNELNKIANAMMKINIIEDCGTNIKQYEIVPVGADWTNREPLLGYPNSLQSDKYVKPENGVIDLIINAIENPDLPFFLILDEMNLSYVERYFSDFLSVMETGEPISLYDVSEKRNEILPKLVLPSNFFIIGTVNIDETTYMFSPKILDRANTIEFRVTNDDMAKFLNIHTSADLSIVEGQGSNMSKSFLELTKNKSFKAETYMQFNLLLIDFFEQLKKIGAEFGYRIVSELYTLIHQLSIIDSSLTDNEKFDIVIMQKILPKLHGSRRRLCPVLIALANLCVTEKIKNVEKEVLIQEEVIYSDTNKIKYPLSLEKIVRMYRNAIDNGFASYAEA